MIPEKIDAGTKTAALEACRAFLDEERLQRAMPLAAHLAEACGEIVRLRAQLGFAHAAGHKRITLCGSARFRRAFAEWTARLMLEQSSMVFTAPAIADLTPAQKADIDLLWMAQIAGSDAILVLDIGGYVGESTAEEIAFAVERGIPVRRLSQEAPGWTEADCRYA